MGFPHLLHFLENCETPIAVKDVSYGGNHADAPWLVIDNSNLSFAVNQFIQKNGHTSLAWKLILGIYSSLFLSGYRIRVFKDSTTRTWPKRFVTKIDRELQQLSECFARADSDNLDESNDSGTGNCNLSVNKMFRYLRSIHPEVIYEESRAEGEADGEIREFACQRAAIGDRCIIVSEDMSLVLTVPGETSFLNPKRLQFRHNPNGTMTLRAPICSVNECCSRIKQAIQLHRDYREPAFTVNERTLLFAAAFLGGEHGYDDHDHHSDPFSLVDFMAKYLQPEGYESEDKSKKKAAQLVAAVALSVALMQFSETTRWSVEDPEGDVTAFLRLNRLLQTVESCAKFYSEEKHGVEVPFLFGLLKGGPLHYKRAFNCFEKIRKLNIHQLTQCLRTRVREVRGLVVETRTGDCVYAIKKPIRIDMCDNRNVRMDYHLAPLKSLCTQLTEMYKYRTSFNTEAAVALRSVSNRDGNGVQEFNCILRSVFEEETEEAFDAVSPSVEMLAARLRRQGGYGLLTTDDYDDSEADPARVLAEEILRTSESASILAALSRPHASEGLSAAAASGESEGQQEQEQQEQLPRPPAGPMRQVTPCDWEDADEDNLTNRLNVATETAAATAAAAAATAAAAAAAAAADAAAAVAAAAVAATAAGVAAVDIRAPVLLPPRVVPVMFSWSTGRTEAQWSDILGRRYPEYNSTTLLNRVVARSSVPASGQFVGSSDTLGVRWTQLDSFVDLVVCPTGYTHWHWSALEQETGTALRNLRLRGRLLTDLFGPDTVPRRRPRATILDVLGIGSSPVVLSAIDSIVAFWSTIPGLTAHWSLFEAASRDLGDGGAALSAAEIAHHAAVMMLGTLVVAAELLFIDGPDSLTMEDVCEAALMSPLFASQAAGFFHEWTDISAQPHGLQTRLHGAIDGHIVALNTVPAAIPVIGARTFVGTGRCIRMSKALQVIMSRSIYCLESIRDNMTAGSIAVLYSWLDGYGIFSYLKIKETSRSLFDSAGLRLLLGVDAATTAPALATATAGVMRALTQLTSSRLM